MALRYKFAGTMRGPLPSGVGTPTGKHASNVCGMAQLKTSACVAAAAARKSAGGQARARPWARSLDGWGVAAAEAALVVAAAK